MGIAMHRAIGYGLEWHAFESRCLFDCESHETRQALEDRFASLKEEDLTVDDEAYATAWSSPEAPSIMEKRLLSRTFTDGGRRPADIGPTSSLYQFLQEPNDRDPTHVLFFPNATYRRRWSRRDDDLDLSFERWREGDDRRCDSSCRSFVKSVPYGHYPWTNYLMLEDGTPEPWRRHVELQERPDIVPAVPAEIRWYLTRHGVLSDEGVNCLRPMLAQWWW